MNHQITATSLTPSRPAPQAPLQRRGTDTPQMYSSSSNSNGNGNPNNSNTNSLSSSGYNSSFTFTPSSPSGSSYATSYSGIGGSPNPSRQSDFMVGGGGMGTGRSGGTIRAGVVSVKEDGTFASWIWKVKWLILKEMTLTMHKSEVR